jgi:hypothetical protein
VIVRSSIDRSGWLRFVLLMVALGALLAAPAAEASAQVRYIAPSPAGRADGSDWANAATLNDLPDMVAELTQGGEILLRADVGPYAVPEPITLGDRQSDAPLVIRGVDPSGGDATPLLVGERAAPYSPETADTGRPILVLDAGADQLTFDNLSFQNVGNGCFVLRGGVQGLTVSNVIATNVRRFIENVDDDAASVSGLIVREAIVRGFSKGAIRLQNDSHNVLLEDVVADSEGQDGDPFAMGFHLTETVHDVVFRRVVAMNARDTVSEYHNGDGFVAESETYGIQFIDTNALGNMDAGYDIKASHVQLVRVASAGNKRNFRLWGTDVMMSSSRGTLPIWRGGTGTLAQVWAGPAAEFVIKDSRFVDNLAGTIVFDLTGAAKGIARRTVIRRTSGSDLSELSEGARLRLNGTWLTS